MNQQTSAIHADTEDARAGNTPHIVRYVLGISTALAIVALSAIWITGAMTTPDETAPAAQTASATSQG